MSDETLLGEVKKRMLISGNAHDNMFKGYINDILLFLKSAGIDTEECSESDVAGVVTKGVSDLWIQGHLSEYFYQRAIQLRTGEKRNV